MGKIIIDRFEGEFAVCEKEDGEMINILISSLPSSIKEGDVLIEDGDNFSVDEDSTEKRRDRIREKIDSLFID